MTCMKKFAMTHCLKLEETMTTKKTPYLAYDVARCNGVEDNQQCSKCLRKIAPGCQYRQSFFSTPPMKKNGECAFLIVE